MIARGFSYCVGTPGEAGLPADDRFARYANTTWNLKCANSTHLSRGFFLCARIYCPSAPPLSRAAGTDCWVVGVVQLHEPHDGELGDDGAADEVPHGAPLIVEERAAGKPRERERGEHKR